jgi:hypothetical protein
MYPYFYDKQDNITPNKPQGTEELICRTYYCIDPCMFPPNKHGNNANKQES